MSDTITTGRVRISYEHLTQPYANQQGAEPKFSATLLIPKTDAETYNKIQAAIQQAIAEGVQGKWNGNRPMNPPNPLHDGDGLRENGERFGDECNGHFVMTASSKQRPEVVDLNLNPIIDATQIYSGMYARVSIRFFAYNSNGKKGIGCGLGNVQKLADGDPLGGKTTAAEDFGAASGYIPPTPQQFQQPMQPQYQTQPQYQAPSTQPQYQVSAQQGQVPQYPGQVQQYPGQASMQQGQPTPQTGQQINPITGVPGNYPPPGSVMGI